MNEKTQQLRDMIRARRPQIEAACEAAGVGLADVVYTTGLAMHERRRGVFGRVTVLLADTAPGWRAKDDSRAGTSRRAMLKRAIADLFPVRVSVCIAAGYSELFVDPSGNVCRRDDSGRTIGVYGE